MKQIIPFNKEITFKTEEAVITSISLNHDLKLKGEDLITGNFYIKGKYKITKTSLVEEEYSYKIPCDIAISDDYETYDATIDIDDFYYEYEKGLLNIHIAVVIDNLAKKERQELENNLQEESFIEKRCIEDEDVDETNNKPIENEQDIIFEHDDDSEINQNIITSNKQVDIITNEKREDPVNIIKQTNEDLFKEYNNYSTYYVYLTNEEDTFNTITDKYNVTKDDILDYNDITDITPGIKLIIPESKNE